jgi:hypothetical protein
MLVLSNGSRDASRRNHSGLAWLAGFVVAIVVALAFNAAARAETSELRISKQPSIIYLPLVVMEQNKLVEKPGRFQGSVDHVQQRWRFDRRAVVR